MATRTTQRKAPQRRNALATQREATLLSPEEVELFFDYSRIDEKARSQVMEAARDIKPRLKSLAREIFTIGRHLNAAKALLPHGEWQSWLQDEFNLSVRSAQNFMAVDNRLSGKNANFAFLDPSALYLLAAASTPEQAVTAVEEQLSEGQTPSYTQVRQVIDTSYADMDTLKNSVQHWLEKEEDLDLTQQVEMVRDIVMDNQAGRRALGRIRKAQDVMPVAWRRRDLLQACEELLGELDTGRSNSTPPAKAVARLHHQLNIAYRALDGQAENDGQAIFNDAIISEVREQLGELMRKLQGGAV
jgi:hypothetical protein